VKLITCPACGGKKIVEETNSDGKICYYADRVTVIRRPCKMCNGSGIVVKDKAIAKNDNRTEKGYEWCNKGNV